MASYRMINALYWICLIGGFGALFFAPEGASAWCSIGIVLGMAIGYCFGRLNG